jgi:hypothetical protein
MKLYFPPINRHSLQNRTRKCFIWGSCPHVMWRVMPLKTPNVTCSGCWRRRSVYYFVLFITSLVVTTITFYNVRWPSDVVSLSGSFDLLSSGPLICSDLPKSTLLSRSSPDWYENTLSKGCLLSSTECWLVLLWNPTIRSLFVVAGQSYLSRWLTMLTSVSVM